MFETVALFVLAFGVFMLAARLFKKKRIVNAVLTPIDAWVEHETARLISEKLSLDENAVTKTISGDIDPEIVSALERGTRKIEVLYERVPGALGGHAADVTVEVSFEDGSISRAARRAPWNEVSQSVRDELARTGSARAYRPFVFAWQR